MVTYLDGLKEITELKTRSDFVQYNEYLNGSFSFNQLPRSEQICLKCELYDQFKKLGYRDSKNFSYLIIIR